MLTNEKLKPDDPEIPGVNLSIDERKRFRSLVQNIGREHIDPRLVLDINFPRFSGVRIAIIKVTSQHRPYKVINTKNKNGIWIREGNACEKANSETIVDFFYEQFVQKATIEIIERITEKVLPDNSKIQDIVNFLIENIPIKSPLALFIRARLFHRIEEDASARRDIIDAIAISPEWRYISFYANMNIKSIQMKFDDLDLRRAINIDDYDLSEIERMLSEGDLSPEDENFINEIRKKLDDLQIIETELSSLQKEVQDVLDILEKTPSGERNDQYLEAKQKMALLSNDVGQRYYQIDKRIKKAIVLRI